MAPSPSSSTLLTAGGAIAVAITSALVTADGQWEPMSVVLGWIVVVATGFSMLSGSVGSLAVAAAVHVARVGVHGIAGGRTPGLVLSAILLVAFVELGSASIEARRVPLDLGPALARALVTASGAGIVVALIAAGIEFRVMTGPGAALVALGAAIGVGALALWVHGRFVGSGKGSASDL